MVSYVWWSLIVLLSSIAIHVLYDIPFMNSKYAHGKGVVHRMSSSLVNWRRASLEHASWHTRRMQCMDLLHQRKQRLRSLLSIRNYFSMFYCTLLLSHFSAFIQPSTAFVYVDNATYPSLPALFGRFMVDGKTYEARLQYFHDNPYLCDIDDKTLSHFVPPTSGAHINHIGGSNLTVYEESIALLVVRGNCPFQRKATVAEYIDESVKILLIANFNLDNVPEEEDTLVPMYSQFGDTRLVLLSISHATGQALKKYLSEQSERITELGGPVIRFDSTPPTGLLSEQDLQSMMLSALGLFFMLISFTGCLVILTGTYHHMLSQTNGENPITAVTQRRLLTAEEVQQLTAASNRTAHPSTSDAETSSSSVRGTQIPLSSVNTRLNDTIEENFDEVEEDQCAVCLGDFDDDSITVLPCDHKFHTSCITPWLTERQSKCPLCKFDVLQHIRNQSAGGEDTDRNPDEIPSTTVASFWDQLRRYRWTSLSTQYNEDEPLDHSLDGVMRVVEVLSSMDLSLNEDDDNSDHRQGGLELTERRRNILT
jgi:Ring finger domain